MPFYLGVDIGTTKMAALVMDSETGADHGEVNDGFTTKNTKDAKNGNGP